MKENKGTTRMSQKWVICMDKICKQNDEILAEYAIQDLIYG